MSDTASQLAYDDAPHMRNLYRHKKRPSWGHAIIAWENPKKRAYRFQDGEVRIFRRGFYGFFEVVEEPEGEELKVFEELQRRQAQLESRPAPAPRAPKKIETRPFGEQLQIFAILYPKAFDDEKWSADVRGDGVARRLKRHRQPGIDEAQELLAQEQMEAASESAEAASTLVDGLIALLGSVDLVTGKQLALLQKLDAEQRLEYVQALSDLLYVGDNTDLAAQFDRLVASMRASSDTPSWQLVTAPAALVSPEKHLAVHGPTLLKQAVSLELALEIPKEPTASAYRRAVDVAGKVRDRLAESERPPRDLMDVREFVWQTMRPAADKVLASS